MESSHSVFFDMAYPAKRSSFLLCKLLLFFILAEWDVNWALHGTEPYDLTYTIRTVEDDSNEDGNCSIPWLMYGTAWKKGNTSALVQLAFTQGFRSFDTANHRKHYSETGVGSKY